MDIYEAHLSNYLKQFDKGPEFFKHIRGKGETENFCVIVEPRQHPYLIPVIKNVMALLQKKGWGLIIFHGTKNEDFIKNGLEDWKNVIYKNLNIDNFRIKDYSDMFKTSAFWKLLLDEGANMVLVFQSDVLLLSDKIEPFLEYDYVGAPWKSTFFSSMPHIKVGNGGFSLRNTQVMYEICEKYSTNTEFPFDLYPDSYEDMWFAFYLSKYNYKVAPVQIARKFSVETIFHPAPFGMHKPYLSEFPNPHIYGEILAKRFIFEED